MARTSANLWTRGDVIALAHARCLHCWGLGHRPGRNGHESVCHCVLRKIFTLVWAKYEKCSLRAAYVSRVSLDRPGSSPRAGSFSFRNEEFLADVLAIARRVLGGRESSPWKLFELHYLRGRDWRYCAPRLGFNRGEFFHEVYRVQQRLGRAFKETQPYALWPLDEYFGSDRRAAAGPKYFMEPERAASPSLHTMRRRVPFPTFTARRQAA